MPLSNKQRESTARYLYDISKGFLLAGVVGVLAGKVGVLAFIGHLITAAYAFVGGLWLEKET